MFSPLKKNFLKAAVLVMALASGVNGFGTRGYYLHFEKVITEFGPSQHTVNSIVQDQRGFLWVGAQDGLYRYDGYELRPYRHSDVNPNSLSDNYVSDLVLGDNSMLWISTQSGGVNGLNTLTEQFVHFKQGEGPEDLSSNDVFTLCRDDDGLIWVGSFNGLDRLDPVTGKTETMGLGISGEKNTDMMVRCLLADGDYIWVGTYSGLYRYNRKTGNVTRFVNHPEDDTSLSGNKIRAVYKDTVGVLWVGTNEQGLSAMTRPGVFKRYKHHSKQANSLSHDQIRSLFEDAEGNLWIGTDNGGLNLYHRKTDDFSHYKHQAFQPNTLPHNEVNAIFQDRSGTMWIGTFGGLSKLASQTRAFHHYFHNPFDRNSLGGNDVAALFEDSQERIWVGSWGGGLCRFDRESRLFTRYVNEPGNPGSLADNEVTAIGEGPGGALWVGTWGSGISVLDPETGQFTHHSYVHDKEGGLGHRQIRAILGARNGGVWVGSWGGGLNYYNPEDGQFTYYRNQPDNPQSLANNIVNCLFEDETGLWVGTNAGGLNFLEPHTKRFVHYKANDRDHRSLSHNRVRDIQKDGAGRMWVATNDGLNRFVPQTRSFITYGEEDGLPSDVIYCVRQAPDGMLWLSTKKGLARFHPESGISHSFDQYDGLQHDRFNQSAGLVCRSGELLFGGINGLNFFKAEDIKINQHRPPVFMTEIRVDGRTINPLEPFRLTHKDRVLHLTFAAMDFTEPEKNRYAYKLDGFDDQWVDHGFEHEMLFTNLDPGSYVFRVKAANNDGLWHRESTDVPFEVLPPFWQTTWAYAFFVFLGAGLIGLAFALKARTHRKAMEARARYAQALEKEVQAKVLSLREKDEVLLQTQKKLISQEKMASLGTLTAGIAHEIKNPLNFVINCATVSEARLPELMELAREEELDREELLACLEDLDEMIALIAKHGKRADDIVRGMLMHSRNQPGSRVSCDLNALLDEYIELTSFTEGEDGVAFEPVLKKDYQSDLPLLPVTPQNLGRVIVNLTNNAFQAMGDKASQQDDYQPELLIQTRREGAMAVILVRDNGPGISEEIQKEIFTPFFTTRDVDGTGLGLSISYDIVVREHMGELTVESEPGQFTQFRVALPLGDTS